MQKPVRILQIVGAMYPGGMENFIMNLYEQIDRDEVQFDFAVHARKENDYVTKIEEMGGRVYLLPRLSSHPLKSLKALKNILIQNEYKAVVRHTSNALVSPQLLVAKKLGIRSVCHSHTSTDPQKLIHFLGRLLMKRATDERIACSPEAGAWMYGKLDYKIVKNAIAIDKFAYSEEQEDRIRAEFDCKSKHIYGHIGNFVYAKNHLFLMEIFKEISILDPLAQFFCIGEGELRQEIVAKISELNLEDKVILTGMRKDAAAFMSAFDMLIFPSIYEGLPLTLVEAQAAGLKAVISDVITRDVIMTENNITYMSLDKGAKEWAKLIYSQASEGFKSDKKDIRTLQREAIAAKGYDNTRVASEYVKLLIMDK